MRDSGGRTVDHRDAAHHERLERLDARLGEAERWLATLNDQVRILRQRAGLPVDDRGGGLR